MFGNSLSMFGTVPHDHHRVRRAALSPYFSKRSVTKLEPIIKSLVERLCTRFHEFQKSGEPLNLEVACSALTTDVITEYAFGNSYKLLEKKYFASEWLEIMKTASQSGYLNMQFAWLLPVMKALPVWITQKANPPMMQLINFRKV